MAPRDQRGEDESLKARNYRLLRENAYGDEACRAATDAAERLAKQFAHHKGVMDIGTAIYHGGVEIHGWFLTKDYLNQLDALIPHEFEGFHVRRNAPFWSIGELATEYRQKVRDWDVVVYGTKEQLTETSFSSLSCSRKRKHGRQ
jgi:hypothetical protein